MRVLTGQRRTCSERRRTNFDAVDFLVQTYHFIDQSDLVVGINRCGHFFVPFASQSQRRVDNVEFLISRPPTADSSESLCEINVKKASSVLAFSARRTVSRVLSGFGEVYGIEAFVPAH